ncbi:MAG TPA: AAA family ATPase, partial [Gemmatimonadales bacterium]|nr:AAA family ATPase [Gemmatimonadales bacterium]
AGVWSWKQKGPQGSVPIPDLDAIAWTGRTVYLVFDSDLATNPDVQRAETALAEELGRRGAHVCAIRLPAGPGGAKVGLDDYLLTETVETFCTLEPLPLVRPDRGHIEVIDLADLLARTFDPPRSLVGPAIVIAAGLSVGGGAPRIGKSLLCSNLALARTFERKWLGFDVEPGVTLYLQAEIPEAWLQRRFDTMVRELADPDPPPVPRGRLHTVTRRGLFLDTPTGRDGLRRILDGLDPHPDLVIVDPLARFYAGDENSQKDVGRFVATLDAFVQDYGCAFVIPHHPSKPVKGDLREGGARLRGMAGLWAAADGCWMLTREDEALVLTFEDLRHGEPPPPIYLDRTPGLWLLPTAGPLPDDRLVAVRKAVLGIGLTYTRLVAAVMSDCEVKERQAKTLISTATAKKLIRKDAQGLYREAQ